MQDVWKRLLVQGVVLVCLIPASESENVLIRPKCKSGSNCEEVKSQNPSERDFFYYIKGSSAQHEKQQVKVTYENDKKSFQMCCNCRPGDVELAIDDPRLPVMPKPTIIKTLELVGCLVPNVSYHDAIKALNISFLSDGILMLSELPSEPRLEGYHLNGLLITELIITAGTDNPPTRPKKDFLNGLKKLKVLELKEGVEPEEDARINLPETLESLTLFNTRLLLPPIIATETQSNTSHWLYRLTSLKNLRLREKSSKLLNTSVTLPLLTFKAFPNLTNLVLFEMLLAPTSNNVSWLKDSNMQNLAILYCLIEEIPANFFEGANIFDINFSYNALRFLPEDLFAPLELSLRKLDLSNNQLKGPDVVRAIQSLKQLETLKVNNNPLGSLCGSGQYYSRVESGLPKQLHRLELRRTQATRICADWIENDHLSVIDLDRNNIIFLWYSDLRMRRKENKSVSLILRNKKNNPVKLIIEQNDYKKCLQESDSKNRGTRMRVQVKLKMNSFPCDCKAYWFHKMLHSCSLLQPEGFFDVNCLTTLGESPLLARNRDSLTCPYQGACPSDCSCNKRLPDNVTVVRCAGALTQSELWPPGLIALHVEPATLTAMPHLKLVELHAPNNNITNIKEIPDTLRVLDVRNNSIEHITTGAAQRLLHLSTNVDYKVSISGNPLVCACEDETAIETLQRAKITDWNNTMCIDGRYVADKRKLCHDKMLPILVTVMGVLLILTLAALSLLYFRPRIKQFLFDRGMCLGYVLNVKDGVDDPTKTHDVFISYSHKDFEIAKELIKRLEGRGHTTIEHIRDWQPGKRIQQQIVDSVLSARRTLLLLSDNYVKSDWSKEEFHVAHAHAMERGSARVIVVLLCDLLSIKNLPDDLRLYLRTNTYLELRDCYFWDKMWRVMPQPRDVVPCKIAVVPDKAGLPHLKKQQEYSVPVLSQSHQSIDKDLPLSKLILVPPANQFEDGHGKLSEQALPVIPVVKEALKLIDNKSDLQKSLALARSPFKEKVALHCVREREIIVDPALLLSRLSLDKDHTELVLVAPVQQSMNNSDKSSGQASPVTPVVTEPPQFSANKSTLLSNVKRESMAPVMDTIVSPSAC